MSLEVMLQELEGLEIELWVEAGKLKYKARDGVMSDDLRGRLKQQREGLVQHLARTPLTHAQQSLWLQQSWDEGTSAYHIAFAVELERAIERDELTSALATLIARHPVLRSRLVSDARGAATITREHLAPDVRLRELGSPSDTGFLRRALEEPFDLGQGCPLRAYLFAGGGRHWLMLVVHHFVADGSSFWLLWRELSALLAGRELPTAGGASYVEHAREEARMLRGPLREAALGYYRERLAGCATLLGLPNDLPYPKTYQVRGATIEHSLGARATRLREVARQLEATPYAVLMTVFGAWLHRLTGQERFVVGCPFLGRTDTRYQDSVGHYVNVLPLRMDFSGSVAFDEAVGETRDELLGAMAHQCAPIGAMLNELPIERHPGRNPLIQAVFALQKLPAEAVVDAGAWIPFGRTSARAVRVPQQEGQFELSVEAVETEQTLDMSFKYNTSLFTEAAMRRYIDCFDTLLDAALDDPLAPVGALRWVPQTQVELVTQAFNQTNCPVAGECILDAILRRCEEQPAALAIRHAGRELSYAELAGLSASIAQQLSDAGCARGTILAIMVPPCVEMAIASVGAWRAGLAYVPIDPEYPDARIRYLLDDSGARAVLCTPELAERVEALAGPTLHVLRTDDLRPLSAPGAAQTPAGSDIAYLVYTSGSSGQPKGVAVSHRALNNLCAWHNQAFAITSRDRASKYAGWGFDASVWEIFPYLAAGASLHVVPEASRLDVRRLNGFFEDARISVAFLPTPICERFVGLPNTSLRLLLTGGDALRCEQHQGSYRLINNYGPSEVCVVSTSGPAARHRSGAIPIGRPVANTQVYVVAKDGGLCPVGVAGELCVAGAQLAQGYWGKAASSEHRFTEALIPGKRLYKTGDRARWLDTGELEFLGRLDRQVKIRGVRIELGEVEQVLAAVAGIESVSALVRTDNGPELTAYYTALAPVSSELLRAHARAHLPAAAVPTHYVQLPALPVTANGKLDEQALPAPAPATTDGDEASFSELEAKLAALWKSHLKLNALKRGDAFFDLGGDSLRAAKLMAEVARDLGVDLPGKVLADTADFGGFCRLVADVMSGQAWLDCEATPEQLRQDAELASHVSISDRSPPGNARRIILTGATGFVGAFLLEELLRNPDVTVSCLVRGRSNAEAHERVRATLLHYGLSESLLERAQVLAADLSKPHLGLDPDTYDRLATTHGQIFHCAALVNFTYSYNALRETNVIGTLRVLELACAGCTKVVHHISAGSAAEASRNHPGDKIREDDPLDAPERLTMGYSQSKWVAERLVQAMFARGLRGTIQRLGLVWGHSQTGVSNLDDLTLCALLSSLELEFMPSWDHVLHFTTVDFTVRAVAALAAATPSNGVYHLTSEEEMSSQQQYELMRELRPGLSLVPYTEWRLRLLDAIEADTSHPLTPFRRFFKEDLHTVPMSFDTSTAKHLLREAGITCPQLSKELLGRYGAYFAQNGVLARALTSPGQRDAELKRPVA